VAGAAVDGAAVTIVLDDDDSAVDVTVAVAVAVVIDCAATAVSVVLSAVLSVASSTGRCSRFCERRRAEVILRFSDGSNPPPAVTSPLAGTGLVGSDAVSHQRSSQEAPESTKIPA
jgi:hypothetical protein